MLGIHRLSGDEIKSVSSSQTGPVVLCDGYREEFYRVGNAVSSYKELESVLGWSDVSTATGFATSFVDDVSGFGIQFTTNADGEGIKTSEITVDADSRYRISLRYFCTITGSSTFRLKIGNTDGGTQYLSKAYNTTGSTFTTIDEFITSSAGAAGSDLFISIIEDSATSHIMTFVLCTLSIKKYDSTIDKNYAEGEFCKIIPITNRLQVSAKSNIGNNLSQDGTFSVVSSNPISLNRLFGLRQGAVIINDHHDGNAVYGNFSKVLVDNGEALLVPATEQSVPRVTTINNQYSAIFDGVDDVINVGPVFTHQDAFTLSAWVYPTSTRGNSRILDRGTYYYLSWDALHDKFGFHVVNGSGVNESYSPSTYALNNWYHVVGVHSNPSSNSFVELYINGVLVASDTDSNTSSTTTDDFHIGDYRSTSPGIPFEGNIDEVSIWTKSLSQDEIRYHLCDYNYDDSNGVRPMDLTLHDTFATNCKLWMRMGD